MPSLWRVIKVFIATAAIAVASAAWAQSRPPVEVDLPAQPLETSLRQIADAQKLQLVYVRSDLAGKQAPAVKGRLTIQEAIDRLLEGTQLVASFNGSDTVVIKPSAEQARGRSSGTAPGAVALSSEARTDRDVHKAESIMVTAQKRSELLIDVPQSVTVLTADDLAKLGALQFRDFANTIPGLNYSTAGAGYTAISLRGVTVGIDASPTVGIYVDEVPYGSSNTFGGGTRFTLDSGLYDLDRIEVLRGPQGTLYGASTMGGLIKYVTKRPDPTRFGGSAQAGISNTENGGLGYNVSGTVNAPIASDTVALRATGFYIRDGGYIDNVALGQKDVNRSDTYGGRVDLLFLPTRDLTLRLTGFLQNISRDGFPVADYNLVGTPAGGSLEQRHLLPESYYQRFRLISGTVTYDFGPAMLTSISSFQTARTGYLIDFSAGFLSAVRPIHPQVVAVGLPENATTDKFTQEVRLASEGTKPLEWLIGGFYTHEKTERTQDLILRDAAGSMVPNDIFTFFYPSLSEEYAAFGDLTWHLTDKFNVTGGARYAKNRQTFEQTGSGVFGSSFPTVRSSDAVGTYLANARYQFSAQATGYLRYATGYRPGGPNYVVRDPTTGNTIGSPTFEADQLKSYEVGYKAEVADGRFGLDVATYYVDWKNIIITVVRGGFGARSNAPGGATVRGAELTVTARPTRAFNVSGAFAYQDARLAAADPDLRAAKGERLPNVPRFTAAINADYDLPLGGLRPTIGTTVRYVGDRMASFNNSSVPQYRAPEYKTVDLRAGMTFGATKVQLYVHNLFDERGQVIAPLGVSPRTGPILISIIQPRTIGITLSTRF